MFVNVKINDLYLSIYIYSDLLSGDLVKDLKWILPYMGFLW